LGKAPQDIPFCLINFFDSPGTPVLIIDNSLKRLWVYGNRQTRPLETFEFQGQGAPEGVFFFQRVLMGKDVPPSIPLANKVYELDYPNPVDRLNGSSRQNTLYLFGNQTHFPASQPPDGSILISLSPEDVSRLSRYILLQHTPLVVCDKVRFVTAKRLNRMREGFLKQLDAWRDCVEKRDIQRLDALYPSGAMALRPLSKSSTLSLDAIAIYYCGKYYAAVFNRLDIGVHDCHHHKVIQYWRHRPHESKIIGEINIPLPEPVVNGRLRPAPLVLDEVQVRPASISLHMTMARHVPGLFCVPVAILEENRQTVYRSLPGVNLEKGVPVDYNEAIPLKNGSNIVAIPKKKRQTVRSVTLFLAGGDGALRQIKTYLVNRDLN
jgi:hypothetical protein